MTGPKGAQADGFDRLDTRMVLIRTCRQCFIRKLSKLNSTHRSGRQSDFPLLRKGVAGFQLDPNSVSPFMFV